MDSGFQQFLEKSSDSNSSNPSPVRTYRWGGYLFILSPFRHMTRTTRPDLILCLCLSTVIFQEQPGIHKFPKFHEKQQGLIVSEQRGRLWDGRRRWGQVADVLRMEFC